MKLLHYKQSIFMLLTFVYCYFYTISICWSTCANALQASAIKKDCSVAATHHNCGKKYDEPIIISKTCMTWFRITSGGCCSANDSIPGFDDDGYLYPKPPFVIEENPKSNRTRKIPLLEAITPCGNLYYMEKFELEKLVPEYNYFIQTNAASTYYPTLVVVKEKSKTCNEANWDQYIEDNKGGDKYIDNSEGVSTEELEEKTNEYPRDSETQEHDLYGHLENTKLSSCTCDIGEGHLFISNIVYLIVIIIFLVYVRRKSSSQKT